MRIPSIVVAGCVLAASLAACTAPPAPAPSSNPVLPSTPTPTGSPAPVGPTPLDPCELVTSADLSSVFGSDLGEGTYAETDRGEMHQYWKSSGCTWTGAAVTLTVELAESNDFLNFEVVCLEPFEPVVTAIEGFGDDAWTARVATGTLVRGCADNGIADVTVSGSSDPVADATAIARVLLDAIP